MLVSLVLSASLFRNKQGQYHNGSSIGMEELLSNAVYWLAARL